MAGDRWVAVGDAAAFLDPIFSTGVLLAMQGGVEAAEAVDAGLRRGDLSAKAFAGYARGVRRRYHHFRRFAVGFYDPAFRELWFRRPRRLAVYRAIVSVLAGNWRPSLMTRLKIEAFFAVVAWRRLVGRVRPSG
jgi:flavin-dependent dehydrogenase